MFSFLFGSRRRTYCKCRRSNRPNCSSSKCACCKAGRECSDICKCIGCHNVIKNKIDQPVSEQPTITMTCSDAAGSVRIVPRLASTHNSTTTNGSQIKLPDTAWINHAPLSNRSTNARSLILPKTPSYHSIITPRMKDLDQENELFK